jgi:hypothetical protein
MPSSVDAWIQTPTGLRRLLAEELAKGLGLPSDWTRPDVSLPASHLNHLVIILIWEALGALIRHQVS